MVLVLLLSCLIVIPGQAGVLSISNIYIEPTGYEDVSTHEWKGSFWIVTALTDTKESYLFYEFNETESTSFGQNKIGNKTVVPVATIKITITPRQPYWERQLMAKSYLVYPQTYGTYRNWWTKSVSKLLEEYVPALYANVLECDSAAVWTLHTPFDVKVEKVGNNAFTKTILVDTVGGTNAVVVSNPADASEKLMVTDLGKIGTGYGQPFTSGLLIFNKTIAFEKTTQLVKAIQYGRDLENGQIIQDENYAFYWFGGGAIYLATGDQGVRDEEVLYWGDDKSPAHMWRYGIDPAAYDKLVADGDFAGSYRDDGPNWWDERIIPIAADILNNNDTTNPSGLSLVNYLKEKFPSEFEDINLWKQGWTITSDNRLRIYMPSGAASSLITIRISTELADSVVYQPILSNGKIEQAFWDSTNTETSTIVDNDTAILKVKQWATSTSKITVTPSIPSGVPASVIPLTDSAIVDPNAVHTFEFKVTNLGTQTNQTSTITFTVSNDLGNVTDTKTLEFTLMSQPTPNPQPQPGPSSEGDPMWIWLVAVIVLVIGSVGGYTVYSRYESQKRKSEGKKV
jgi:hypothetical protein